MRQSIQRLKTLAGDVVTDVKVHWNRPGKNRVVPYKEIMNYGIGGMGKDMLFYFISFMGLAAGNTLLGSTLGIRPMHLQTIQMGVSMLGFITLLIRGYIVDNTNTRWGKFRPIIAVAGIPLAVIMTVFMFLDFETMTYSNKLTCVIGFSAAISIINPFVHESFTGLGQVMTPNSAERAGIVTIYSIMYSIAPTIYGFFVPLLSQFTGGLTNINTYRWIVVPVGLIGVGLTFFAAFGCKERTITAKSYVQKVNVLKGMRLVFRNKYWWIRNTSAWVAFLENASKNVFAWMFIYEIQDMTSYSFVGTFLGSSALIAMLLTPLLLSKLGNKKLVLFHNGSNILFIIGMMLTFRSPVLFVLFLFVNNLVNYFTIVYNPVMDAEVKDYQHYLCGKRVDGCFTAAAIINIPIGIATGFALPFIYECFGLTMNYDILYDVNVRNTMFFVLFGLSIAGAVVNLLPFFWYDFTRQKHASIIRVIRLRAMIEDYADNNLESRMIKKGVEDYREVCKITQTPLPDSKELKSELKEKRSAFLQAKKTGIDIESCKHEYKSQRKYCMEMKVLAEDKKHLSMYWDEFHKFSQPINILHLQLAEYLKNIGREGLIDIYMQGADSLIKNVGSEVYDSKDKKQAKFFKQYIKRLGKMLEGIAKYYIDGFNGDEQNAFLLAQEMPQTTKMEYRIKKEAVRTEKRKIKRYNNIMEFYLEELRFVKQYEGLRDFDKILDMYEDACEKVALEDSIREEEDNRIKKEKQDEIERVRKERFDKMSVKKQERVLQRKKKKEAKLQDEANEADSVQQSSEDDNQGEV